MPPVRRLRIALMAEQRRERDRPSAPAKTLHEDASKFFERTGGDDLQKWEAYWQRLADDAAKQLEKKEEEEKKDDSTWSDDDDLNTCLSMLSRCYDFLRVIQQVERLQGENEKELAEILLDIEETVGDFNTEGGAS